MRVPDGKRPDIIVRETTPFNAGPTPQQMGESAITPNDLFFVRNHGDVPTIDPHTFRLTVNGLVAQELSLSLDALYMLPSHTVLSTLQCAGNRRRELVALAPIPDELEWDMEAISTAEWRGARLRDVLALAGVDEAARHVAFLGCDDIEKKGDLIRFGGSIPLDKALDPDTLLAYEMNGSPLPPLHGYPLRTLVPGYIGARSVKWLSQMTLQAQPSDNYYQARAYQLFPSDTQPETADWSQGLQLGELPLNCVITAPQPNDTLPAGDVVVRGYALALGREVARVDVSADGGATWQVAVLQGETHKWGWRWWECRIALPAGAHDLVARAWDTAANTQPERIETVWNFKGYMNNAWHRVGINIR